MKVIFTRAVLKYLENLIIILYQKEYFGFLNSSTEYVAELLDSIKNTLPLRLHKPAPGYFDRYGKNMEYAVFRKSKHTCWYVFFKTYYKNGETVLLVRYITNNHVAAHHL